MVSELKQFDGGRAALLGKDEAVSLPKQIATTYNDAMFFAFFVANVLFVFILALGSGISSLLSTGSKIVSIRDGKRIVDSAGLNSPGKMIGGAFFIMILGGSLSIAWIYALSRMAAKMINITFVIILSVSTISAFSLLIAGSYLAGLGLLVCSFAAVGVFMLLKPRIAFASANLKVACEAIRAMPATILVAAAALAVQGVFCLFWIMATLGAATNEASKTIVSGGVTYNLNQCTTYRYSSPLNIGESTLGCKGGICNACVCNGSNIVYANRACLTQRVYGGVYFGLLLSLLWTSAVIANTVHCTVSGSVASWWFDAAADIEAAEAERMNNAPFEEAESGVFGWVNGTFGLHIPTHGYWFLSPGSQRSLDIVHASLRRSLTTSFGSICLGSLVVAILRTLRALAIFTAERLKKIEHPAGRNLRVALVTYLQYALEALDRAMTYFNRYAFCYVAIYGMNFLEASQAVVTMFSERGWSTLLNDDIIDTVLLVAHTVGGLICVLVAYAYSSVIGLTSVNTTLLTVLGFFVGFLMFLVTMKTVSSAVSTVYVCFAERPDTFAASHPTLYKELADAWGALYIQQRQSQPQSHANDKRPVGSGGGGGGAIIFEAASIPNHAATAGRPHPYGGGGGGGIPASAAAGITATAPPTASTPPVITAANAAGMSGSLFNWQALQSSFSMQWQGQSHPQATVSGTYKPPAVSAPNRNPYGPIPVVPSTDAPIGHDSGSSYPGYINDGTAADYDGPASTGTNANAGNANGAIDVYGYTGTWSQYPDEEESPEITTSTYSTTEDPTPSFSPSPPHDHSHNNAAYGYGYVGYNRPATAQAAAHQQSLATTSVAAYGGGAAAAAATAAAAAGTFLPSRSSSYVPTAGPNNNIPFNARNKAVGAYGQQQNDPPRLIVEEEEEKGGDDEEEDLVQSITF